MKTLNNNCLFAVFHHCTDGYTYHTKDIVGVFDNYDKAVMIAEKKMREEFEDYKTSDEHEATMKKAYPKRPDLWRSRDRKYTFKWSSDRHSDKIEAFRDENETPDESEWHEITIVTINEEIQ